MEIIVDSRRIGVHHPPFLIAELSANHNQSLDRALAITEAAALAGADAIKLQTYTADTMTLDVSQKDFMITDPDSPWAGETLYSLYKKACTPWDWHQPIFDKARELGMIPFSTPFDESAVNFLEDLDVPCYKIASFENNHLPLIRKVAQTGKPIFLSTGMADFEIIEEAVEAAHEEGCDAIILMKCTSSYPAKPRESNLRTLPDMRSEFDREVGLSDHTLGIGVAVASVVYGAVAIEKHFSLDRGEGGLDATFSLEPREFESLVVETKRAWQSLGEVKYGSTSSEKASEQFRRSIYTTKNLKAGDRLSVENIRIVRPGFGLPPKFFEEILGCKVACELPAGSPVTRDILLGQQEIPKTQED